MGKWVHEVEEAAMGRREGENLGMADDDEPGSEQVAR
jgi:hypothetical protein